MAHTSPRPQLVAFMDPVNKNLRTITAFRKTKKNMVLGKFASGSSDERDIADVPFEEQARGNGPSIANFLGAREISRILRARPPDGRRPAWRRPYADRRWSQAAICACPLYIMDRGTFARRTRSHTDGHIEFAKNAGYGSFPHLS